MAHISERKFRDILRCFTKDCTVSTTATLTGVSRPTISRIRHRIVEIDIASALELGEFEVDESYFSARRVLGKRGRGAAERNLSSVY